MICEAYMLKQDKEDLVQQRAARKVSKIKGHSKTTVSISTVLSFNVSMFRIGVSIHSKPKTQDAEGLQRFEDNLKTI